VVEAAKSSSSEVNRSWPSGIRAAAAKVVMVFSALMAKSVILVSFLVLPFSGPSIHHSSCPGHQQESADFAKKDNRPEYKANDGVPAWL
jgi:hypothetical protein